MQELIDLIQKRQSSLVIFDPERAIAKDDLQKILEAARWAPTTHNMQNFEVVVNDKKVLKKISKIENPVSLSFVRENYLQMSFSEEELCRKKVGVFGTMFPPEWRDPKATQKEFRSTDRIQFMEQQINSSSVLCIVLFNSERRAPASEGDFLGAISLGCVMENMWLMTQSLGIAFHVVSSLSQSKVEKRMKQLLNIPTNLKIAFSFRLGYPLSPLKYLRVRRDIKDFTHYNGY